MSAILIPHMPNEVVPVPGGGAARTAPAYYRFKPWNIGRMVVWGVFALLLIAVWTLCAMSRGQEHNLLDWVPLSLYGSWLAVATIANIMHVVSRYFDPKGPGRWVIKAPIKNRVEFRPFNLLDSYASFGKFDIVFCRNVLIYFSAEVKKDILLRIHSTLKPGGYLFLGASEALNGLPDHYQMVQCSPGIIYQAK